MPSNDLFLTEELTSEAKRIKNKVYEDIGWDIYGLGYLAGVIVRFVEINGLVKVVFELDDNTTHKELRDVIPTMLKIRDKVNGLQDEKIAARMFLNIKHPTRKEEFLELFSYVHENGVSYKKLAERINRMVSDALISTVKIQQKNNITTEELFKQNKSIKFIDNLLGAIGVKNIGVEDAIELIKEGKPPFEEGYPVSRWKLIETLRTWRKGKMHQSVKKVIKKARSRKKET